MVVRLEDRCLVSGSTSNAIAVRHDISKLVKVLEDVDAYTSVKACRLEHPQVLLVVRAFRQFVRSLERLFFLLLYLLNF